MHFKNYPYFIFMFLLGKMLGKQLDTRKVMAVSGVYFFNIYKKNLLTSDETGSLKSGFCDQKSMGETQVEQDLSSLFAKFLMIFSFW